MKPRIYCIIGESGSGKSMIAEELERLASIPMIRSYTDRPKRDDKDIGHAFLEPAEYDLLKEEDMIAKTEWSGRRYCCLKSDVQDVNSYVIDEAGIIMLRHKFQQEYKIFAIRIKRPLDQRVAAAGKERVDRDNGKFNLPDGEFDIVIHNKGTSKLSVILDVWRFVRDKELELRQIDALQKEYERGMEYELRD
jgi:guanylate kinase